MEVAAKTEMEVAIAAMKERDKVMTGYGCVCDNDELVIHRIAFKAGLVQGFQDTKYINDTRKTHVIIKSFTRFFPDEDYSSLKDEVLAFIERLHELALCLKRRPEIIHFGKDTNGKLVIVDFTLLEWMPHNSAGRSVRMKDDTYWITDLFSVATHTTEITADVYRLWTLAESMGIAPEILDVGYSRGSNYSGNHTVHLYTVVVKGYTRGLDIEKLKLEDKDRPPGTMSRVKALYLQLRDMVNQMHGERIYHSDLSLETIRTDRSGKIVFVGWKNAVIMNPRAYGNWMETDHNALKEIFKSYLNFGIN